jgi:hypothetical protein
METKILLEKSTPYCLSESWTRNLVVLMDRPLSAAYWNLGEMTGEDLLDELPPLVVEKSKIPDRIN